MCVSPRGVQSAADGLDWVPGPAASHTKWYVRPRNQSTDGLTEACAPLANQSPFGRILPSEKSRRTCLYSRTKGAYRQGNSLPWTEQPTQIPWPLWLGPPGRQSCKTVIPRKCTCLIHAIDREGWFHQAFDNHTEMPFRENILRSGTLYTHSMEKILNGVLLKSSGRIEDFQDAGYGRSMNLDGVNLFVLIEQIYQIFREIFGRNSFSVGPGCERFPLRIVNIAWRISQWIGCHVHNRSYVVGGCPFLRLECCYDREQCFHFEWRDLEKEYELL